jgi:hypothetical protein
MIMKNEDQSAFARPSVRGRDVEEWETGVEGLTKAEYFAAAALGAVIRSNRMWTDKMVAEKSAQIGRLLALQFEEPTK